MFDAISRRAVDQHALTIVSSVACVLRLFASSAPDSEPVGACFWYGISTPRRMMEHTPRLRSRSCHSPVGLPPGPEPAAGAPSLPGVGGTGGASGASCISVGSAVLPSQKTNSAMRLRLLTTCCTASSSMPENSFATPHVS